MGQRLAISLAVTLGVASLCAWPFVYLGVNYFSGIAFFTVLQFIGFYFYTEHVKRRVALQEQTLILAREAELSRQGAEVVCPCDRNVKCFVPIVLGEYNTYNCPGCKKDIHIMINYKTALVTTPVTDTPDTVIKQSLT